MKKLFRNTICSLLICLFLVNVLFDNTGDCIIAVGVPTNVETSESTEESDDVSVEDLDVPIVGTSYERDEAINLPEQNKTPEICKSQYQVENEIIKEEEVGYYDHGDVACASVDVDPYPGYFTKYMDLKCRNNVSIDQMNDLIDHWLKGRDSELKGQGEAFIKASQETGLDPVFLLSLAAQESGWTVSNLHATKNNPYSINMVDSNPSQGYHLGDKFSDGIINGAKWIKKHYYDEGQTTLHGMIYGKKKYSSSADKWINDISNIITKSYNYILSK